MGRACDLHLVGVALEEDAIERDPQREVVLPADVRDDGGDDGGGRLVRRLLCGRGGGHHHRHARLVVIVIVVVLLATRRPTPVITPCNRPQTPNIIEVFPSCSKVASSTQTRNGPNFTQFNMYGIGHYMLHYLRPFDKTYNYHQI